MQAIGAGNGALSGGPQGGFDSYSPQIEQIMGMMNGASGVNQGQAGIGMGSMGWLGQLFNPTMQGNTGTGAPSGGVAPTTPRTTQPVAQQPAPPTNIQAGNPTPVNTLQQQTPQIDPSHPMYPFFQLLGHLLGQGGTSSGNVSTGTGAPATNGPRQLTPGTPFPSLLSLLMGAR